MRTFGMWRNFLFACYVVGFCPSLAQTPGQTKQVKGTVGGSVTFLAPVLKTGSLTYKPLGSAAMVLDGNSNTELIPQLTGRLQWGSQTGLFTITHLRSEDSGMYVVDCNDEQNKIITGFQLDVYKNVSKPTVTWIQLGIKNCSVLCSVENGREVTLSWQREGEMLSHSSSPDMDTALSLLMKLDREGNTYCVAKNPVSSQRYMLEIPSNCTKDSDQKLPGIPRNYTIVIAVATCLLLCVIIVMGKTFYLQRKCLFTQDTSTLGQWEPDQNYAEISHNDQRETPEQTDSRLTTVYDELQLCRDPAAAEC
ncbi:uncharacterized protein LOC133130922 [Conger conger]|uniref:uncharacterized protein LOC133130922 n=1 Tax=Conger conger TaxID=82655 RepID=UPI002A5A2B5D|nr:uncharacterized protein LOC133130922 [Conger conger]XP_061101911.1 uncharacterized protein LOC133130922 [Conger conger]